MPYSAWDEYFIHQLAAELPTGIENLRHWLTAAWIHRLIPDFDFETGNESRRG